MKELTKQEIEWRYIMDLITRKNAEVVAIMKKIPSSKLFGWKFEEKKC